MTVKCEYSELVDPDKLIPHPRNANKHSDRQIELLAKNIKHQGWRLPIVVSKRSGFIVAGHGRLDAALTLSCETVPVSYQDFESEAEEFQFLISDNKLASLAEHDDAFMIEGIKQLEIEDFELLGMDDFHLPDEPDPAKEEIEDDIPSDVETRCKPGDLWILGEHRLLCGDATNIQHVERIMGGEKADMVFTDPPYNVNYEGSDGQKIKNDKMDSSKFLQFCRDFYASYFGIAKEGAAIYVFHSSSEVDSFVGSFKEVGFHFSGYLIWNKNSLIMGRSDYHWKHEPCIYGWKPGANHNWYSDRKQTTVFDHDKGSSVDSKMHPTVKPISLVEYYMKNSSQQGDLVCDFFGGSGSTLIASEKNSRKCYTMELDPHYCDVILSRWEKYSGKEAKLNG